MGIDGTVHTPEWSFRGAVILPGGVKRVCSSVKSGVLLRNSPIPGQPWPIYDTNLLACTDWPFRLYSRMGKTKEHTSEIQNAREHTSTKLIG